MEAIDTELLTEETQSMLNATNDLASKNADEENSDSDEDASKDSEDGEIESSAGSKWTTGSLTHQVMRLWKKNAAAYFAMTTRLLHSFCLCALL